MPSLPTATLRVASIPFAPHRGDIEHNVAHVVARIEQAALNGVGLAVFPEACLTGGMEGVASPGARTTRRSQVQALAESIDGQPMRAVADAVERTGVAAGVGLIERASNGELYSSYAVCLPGGERHVHRKLHADGQRHIARGHLFTVFDTRWGWRLAVLVGGDNYLVENARMAALLGAVLLVAPHAQTGATESADATATATIAWMRRALPSRALDNGMFVVYSDGTQGGADKGESGAAAIVDPCGHVIARGTQGDGMIAADLDPALIGTSPGHRWLEARRPDLYARLAAEDARADAHEAQSGFAAFEPRTASPRGSVAVSFAIVGRDRLRF
jgi:predicted amidohydrolase